MDGLPMTGCRDCDSSTWRCWRHAVVILMPPVIYTYPTIVVPSPTTVPYEPWRNPNFVNP